MALAALAAVALLGTAAVAYTGTRALGIGPAAPLLARGVVSEQKPIVLADFGSATGDSLLARAITTALRVAAPAVHGAGSAAAHPVEDTVRVAARGRCVHALDQRRRVGRRRQDEVQGSGILDRAGLGRLQGQARGGG